MRKLIAFSLVLVVLVSLAACNKITNNSSYAKDTSISENSSAESTIVVGETSVTTIKATEKTAVNVADSAQSTIKSAETTTPPKQASTEQKAVATTTKKAGTATATAPITTAATTAATTPAATTKKVTITEGLSFIQIAKLLEQNGICTKQELLDTVNSYDYSYYPLIGALGNDANRCFKLEGYLYPDTYEFYIDQAPQNVLGKMLKNSESKITADYRQRASELGYSMDQVITLASIIEKESNSHSQMKTVSSVLYNRLNAGKKLQCDSTINYIEWYVKPVISGDVNRYNSYYNTYKCSALPEGPICSPGKTAIEAALYPETTDYLYFVSDKAGNYYYAATYEEHLANCKKAGVTSEQ